MSARKNHKSAENQWRNNPHCVGYTPPTKSKKIFNGLAFTGWILMILVGLVILKFVW